MTLCVTISEADDPNAPFLLQGDSLCNLLDRAAEAGFDGVELQLGDPKTLDQDRFLEKCNRLGLKLVSIATGPACGEGLSLSALDEDLRCASVARLCRQIEFAAKAGGANVMIGLMIGRQGEGTCEQHKRALGTSLRELSVYGDKYGVKICVEPVNHIQSNMLNSWKEMTHFLNREDCPEVRLGLDLFHMRMEELDIVSTIRRYGDRIGLVQIMDDNRKAPGFGNFQFDKIVSAILKTGYNGPIIMECLPFPDSQTGLKKAMEFYQKYFKK